MSKLAEIAKLLDLPEDADNVTLLAAVAQLAADSDADDFQPAGDVTDQRYTYFWGDDVVEREDTQTREQSVFHVNGAGYWYKMLGPVDLRRTRISAADAQERCGPGADLEAATHTGPRLGSIGSSG